MSTEDGRGRAPDPRRNYLDNPWGLSRAECEFMAALCKYGSAKAAAYSLNRSPKTADTHMLHIRDKMRPLSTNILRCLAYRDWERTAPKVYPVGAGDGDTYVVPGPVVIHKAAMTLNMDDRHMAALEALAAEQDMNKTQVMTQALRLYQVVHERAKNGQQLAFTKDGKVVPCWPPLLPAG